MTLRSLPFVVLAALCLASASVLASPLDLPNLDFEDESSGWTIREPETPMSSIVTEAARDGKGFGLKVEDNDSAVGSNAFTGKVPIQPGREYKIAFWARSETEREFISVYAVLADAAGQEIPLGEQAPSQRVRGNTPDWVEYEFTFTAPHDAAALGLRVHSWSSGTGIASFDDFRVEEVK